MLLGKESEIAWDMIGLGIAAPESAVEKLRFNCGKGKRLIDECNLGLSPLDGNEIG
jgi:hypothetical protein